MLAVYFFNISYCCKVFLISWVSCIMHVDIFVCVNEFYFIFFMCVVYPSTLQFLNLIFSVHNFLKFFVKKRRVCIRREVSHNSYPISYYSLSSWRINKWRKKLYFENEKKLFNRFCSQIYGYKHKIIKFCSVERRTKN